MKRTIILAIACAIFWLPASALAQTKKRTTARRPRVVAPVKKTDEVVRAGATRVADQIKLLTKFIYVMGGVAQGLQQADEAIKRHEASPTVIEQTEKSKARVRDYLAEVRGGLEKLEQDFHATPELELYYITLSGVSAGVATAEQQACANQFDQSGRSLLGVVNRLTDVLLGMRKP